MKNLIHWQDGIPFSNIYDDIYFSKENGLLETNHVFIEGNKLPQRWNGLNNSFHIVETGFGTGLNFFSAWKLWQEIDNDRELHFTSVEKYPLSLRDIQKAISNWPEFKPYTQEFAQVYPDNPAGETKIYLGNNKIHLHILWGDASEVLGSLNLKADAWFLDGFAPSKNPDMWCDKVYKEVARLTASGGTFATFTVAGAVRRGLEANGFTISKVPGFGKKREILVGVRM